MWAPPFVGRDAHLRALAEAAAHDRAVVLLDGEAGAGKTRLVREWLAAPGAPPALVGHCHPAADPFPYGPLVEALHAADPPTGLGAVCGALRPLLPEAADRLPPPPPPAPGPAAERHRVLRAFTALLHALAPRVLVIEDAQWLDPDTRTLLDYLAPRLPGGLRLLLTHRADEPPAGPPLSALLARLPHGAARTELSLPPLPADAVAALTADALGRAATSGGAADRLARRTRGNAFTTVEVLRHLAARGAAPDDLDAHGLPAPLRGAVLERVARLPRPARRAVRAAAVLAAPATEDALAAVAGLGPARAARGVSAARALLTTSDGGTIALRDPLLGRIVDDALPAHRRRRLHRRAAAALARLPDPPHDRLARHHREAGQLDAWTAHAEQAADRAAAAGDDTAAAEHLRDALRRPGLDADRRCGLAVKLGRAALNGLATEETVPLLERIIAEEELPPHARGELRLELGLLLLNASGQGPRARRELVRAAAELPDRLALAARAMSALAVPRATPEPLETHRRWMDRAVAAARRSGDPLVRTAVAVNRATLLAQVGDPAAWDVAFTGGPADRPHRRELARAALNLADAATMLGHHDRAERHLRRTTALAADTDAPYLLVAAESTGLLLHWAAGRWGGLADRAEAAARAARAADLPLIAAEADLVRAGLALAGGEPAAAERLLRDVQYAAAARNIVPLGAATAGTLARLLLARRDPAAAWAETEPVLRLIEAKGVWVWAAELTPAIEALIASCRADAARALTDRFTAGLRGTSAPAARAALLRWRALLAAHDGAPDRAADLHAEAAAAYRALPRPYDAAHATEARGRSLRADGVDHLTRALDGYLSLGATWDAARCRRALRDLGVATPHVGQRGYGTELSPREREIVRLAAAGHTNREIAALLYLSPRTVETHVANALGKLGLRSRRELAPAPAANTTYRAPAAETT
ncbi:AAA family ATPase [Nocardiopsis trehalosi]|uniref:AAA family ATPase n=1 Tax=Nocardiopsis trehalosi TaxID=109329 RepID=UPI000831AC21|nr:LuxR family transcriptional regulator [Nocardiopsis trehalosi]